MKTVELTCNICHKKFYKETREYNRQIRRGRTEFFCSRSCSSTDNNRRFPRPGNVSLLKADNRRDEFTPFRWFILRAQYRDRKKKYGCDLDVQYLKTLWELQTGICPFTGWELILPHNTKEAWETSDPANASLDRIDNSIGYVKGNVRFVSVMANLARQVFSDEQVKNFCKAVVNNEMAT